MSGRTFLTATWRDLAVLNFEVDPALLTPHLPAGTELDLWDGKTLVSLVGFRFLETKVLGLAIPLHRDFDEINLRFYVRGDLGRGVVFIREIVPRHAVAAIARIFYGERYVALPMRHSRALRDNRLHVSYGWKQKGNWSSFAVEAQGEPVPLVAGSPEEFIFEHYFGYTKTASGSNAYRVEHPPWRVWNVTGSTCGIDGAALYGKELGAALQARPHSAMLAEGSPITVARPERPRADPTSRED